MDVHDPHGELADEVRRDEPHEPREDDEVRPFLLQDFHDLALDGGNYFRIADRTARLRDRDDAPLRQLIEAIPEREVGVAHRYAPAGGAFRLVAGEHARVDPAHLARPDTDGPFPVHEDD